MKRFISIFTVILMLVSCCVFSTGTISAADGDYTYTTVDGGVEITGYTGAGGDVTIPSTLGGYAVKGIGQKAFYQNKTIGKVTISEGIEYIGARAFAGSMITGIEMSDSVTALGNSAFSSCVYLENITLSAGIDTIPNSCFYLSTRLESVEIPEGVKVIDDMAFQSSNHLAKVTFPSTLKSIGEYAFAYTGLTKVIIPEGTEAIEASAFFICDKLTDVIINGTVKTIGDFAFANCYTLTSLTLGDGIEVIGTSAFDSCAITEIIIPDSVTEIGEFAIGYVYDEISFDYALADDIRIICKEGTAGYAYAMSNGFQNVEAIPADTTAPTETTEVTEATSEPVTSENTEPSSVVTEPVSSDNTEPSSTEEITTTPCPEYEKGDVNRDFDVNIKDATAIQKHVAALITLNEYELILADYNDDLDVNIKDATAIQKFIAGIAA